MFDQVDKKYQIKCDGCGTVNYTDQRSFHQARNVSSVEGWDHRQLRGVWHNYCPRCAEDANPELELVGIHFFKKSESE
jgi:hypothetical protein